MGWRTIFESVPSSKQLTDYVKSLPDSTKLVFKNLQKKELDKQCAKYTETYKLKPAELTSIKEDLKSISNEIAAGSLMFKGDNVSLDNLKRAVQLRYKGSVLVNLTKLNVSNPAIGSRPVFKYWKELKLTDSQVDTLARVASKNQIRREMGENLPANWILEQDVISNILSADQYDKLLELKNVDAAKTQADSYWRHVKLVYGDAVDSTKIYSKLYDYALLERKIVDKYSSHPEKIAEKANEMNALKQKMPEILNQQTPVSQLKKEKYESIALSYSDRYKLNDQQLQNLQPLFEKMAKIKEDTIDTVVKPRLRVLEVKVLVELTKMNVPNALYQSRPVLKYQKELSLTQLQVDTLAKIAAKDQLKRLKGENPGSPWLIEQAAMKRILSPIQYDMVLEYRNKPDAQKRAVDSWNLMVKYNITAGADSAATVQQFYKYFIANRKIVDKYNAMPEGQEMRKTMELEELKATQPLELKKLNAYKQKNVDNTLKAIKQVQW